MTRAAFKYQMPDLFRFERLQLNFFIRTKLDLYMVVIRIEYIDLPDPNFRNHGDLVRNVVFTKVVKKLLHSRGTECHMFHPDVFDLRSIIYFHQMNLGNITTI